MGRAVNPSGGVPVGGDRRGSGGWETVLADEAHLVAPGGEWRWELWRVAVEQFDRAANLLGLDPEVRSRLVEPCRALTVNFPVRRDNGEVEIFTGYRVQHTLTMGPTKGGSLRTRRVARRVRRAGDVDDPQVSARRPAIWWREGGRALRPEPSLAL